jgi:hypothetical protein
MKLVAILETSDGQGPVSAMYEADESESIRSLIERICEIAHPCGALLYPSETISIRRVEPIEEVP